MSRTESLLPLLSVFIVIAIVIAPPALPAEEDEAAGGGARAAALKCPECKGWGKRDCPACSGASRVDGPCPACAGSGTERCARCVDGQRPCTKCGGTGERAVLQAGLGGGVRMVECPRTLRCGACKGRAGIPCKKCKGKGIEKIACPPCSGGGKMTCLRCGGEGEIAAEVTVEVVERDDPVVIASQVDRARTALRLIQSFGPRMESLSAEREKLASRSRALEGRVLAVYKQTAEDPAVHSGALVCMDKWKTCERSQAGIAEAAVRVEAHRPASKDHVGEIRKLLAALEDEARPKIVSEDSLRQREEFAAEYRASVEALDAELKDLSRVLGRCEEELEDLQSKHRERLEKREKEGREQELTRKAYQAIRGLVPKIALRSGLPEVETLLLPSRSPDALEVQVVYFDPDTLVANDLAGELERSAPSDASLEDLPRFITGIFKECPAVARAQVIIDANVVGDTGHPERRAIQKFTADRARWKELMTGQFKDDWRALLSKSKPSPEYPRPPGNPLLEGWPLLLFIVVLVLALAVVYVARTRMAG